MGWFADARGDRAAGRRRGQGLGCRGAPAGAKEAGTITLMPREQKIHVMVETHASQLATHPVTLMAGYGSGAPTRCSARPTRRWMRTIERQQLRPDGLDMRLQELAALFNQRASSAPVLPWLEALPNQAAAVAPDGPEVVGIGGLRQCSVINWLPRRGADAP
jgi:hypothetical protein